MGIFQYVRWRLSPQGRSVYQSYAKRQRTLSPAPARAPRYNSRKARTARRDAAIERNRQAPRMVPNQVTSHWPDGRTRVTDFDTRTGRKVRTHETRSRAKDSDGMRPRQRRTAR
jgi:hypothetical protein